MPPLLRNPLRIALPKLSATSLLTVLVCVHAQALSQAQAPTRPAADAREPITLNFTDAEIEAVARTMASLTGRDIVVDPRVKGTISLTTERPVTPQAAYQH